VLLSAGPFDSQVVSNLPVIHPNLAGHVYGYLIGFNFGRPVYVVVLPVPEFSAIVPPPNVGEFVQDVKVEDSVLASLEVSKPEIDPSPFIVNVRVGVLGNEVTLVSAKTFSRSPSLNRALKLRSWSRPGKTFVIGFGPFRADG